MIWNANVHSHRLEHRSKLRKARDFFLDHFCSFNRLLSHRKGHVCLKTKERFPFNSINHNDDQRLDLALAYSRSNLTREMGLVFSLDLEMVVFQLKQCSMLGARVFYFQLTWLIPTTTIVPIPSSPTLNNGRITVLIEDGNGVFERKGSDSTGSNCRPSAVLVDHFTNEHMDDIARRNPRTSQILLWLFRIEWEVNRLWFNEISKDGKNSIETSSLDRHFHSG